MRKFKDIAVRLADYHGCRITREYVREHFGKKSLVFMFACGNGYSFDTDECTGSDSMPYRTLTYRQLVEKYVAGTIFVMHRRDDFSDEWNNFPLRIIKVSSVEELDLRLAAAGY